MEISQITTFKNEHYELLLIADPNRKLVAHYLEHSVGFQMIEEGKLVGVLVLTPINQTQIELKNISIATKLQHQGKAQFFFNLRLNMLNKRTIKKCWLVLDQQVLCNYTFTKRWDFVVLTSKQISLPIIMRTPFLKTGFNCMTC